MEIRIFQFDPSDKTILKIYCDGVCLSYSPISNTTYLTKDTLEMLIKSFYEATEEYIENFSYNKILEHTKKFLQESQ